jgi:hypothetical protein
VHDSKQADYGSNTDPFANIRSCEAFGIPAWVGAMVGANDNISRLKNVAQGKLLENDPIADAFRDLAVFAIIGWVLWEETRYSGLETKEPQKKKYWNPLSPEPLGWQVAPTVEPRSILEPMSTEMSTENMHKFKVDLSPKSRT